MLHAMSDCLEAGAEVVFLSGPFARMSGRLAGVPEPRGRVRVRLVLLGREIEVETDPDVLRPSKSC